MANIKRKRTRSVLGQALLLSVVAGLILFMGWSYSQAHRAERAYTNNNLMMVPDDEAVQTFDEAVETYEETSLLSPGPELRLTPANAFRFHIPANSDEERDQKIKDVVKNAVMERFGAVVEGAANAAQAEKLLSPLLSEVEMLANERLEAEGVSYRAEASLKTVHFPEMTYLLSGRRVYLPEGDYRALQVTLGSGKGANWWCLMYPPLCYFDLVQSGVIPGAPSSVPASGPWTEGAEDHGDGSQNGVIMIDESLAEEVRVEVRSLLLDAIRAGIIRIGKALSVLAQGALGQETTRNMD